MFVSFFLCVCIPPSIVLSFFFYSAFLFPSVISFLLSRPSVTFLPPSILSLCSSWRKLLQSHVASPAILQSFPEHRHISCTIRKYGKFTQISTFTDLPVFRKRILDLRIILPSFSHRIGTGGLCRNRINFSNIVLRYYPKTTTDLGVVLLSHSVLSHGHHRVPCSIHPFPVTPMIDSSK